MQGAQKQTDAVAARRARAVNIYTDWIKRGLADLEAGIRKSPAVERMIREAAAAKGITS